MAAEAQQPRQPTQGVQRHLHGGNEDGMDCHMDLAGSLCSVFVTNAFCASGSTLI